jgi:hypothetical protein
VDLISAFLTYQNLIVVVAASGVLIAVQKLLPSVHATALWARLQIPVAFGVCVGAAYLPHTPPLGTWGDKLLLGLALGGVVVGGGKLFLQSFLGRDDRITGAAVPSLPAPSLPMSEAPTPPLIGVKP